MAAVTTSVRSLLDNHKAVYIDKKGDVVISLDFLDSITDVNNFSEGLALF